LGGVGCFWAGVGFVEKRKEEKDREISKKKLKRSKMDVSGKGETGPSQLSRETGAPTISSKAFNLPGESHQIVGKKQMVGKDKAVRKGRVHGEALRKRGLCSCRRNGTAESERLSRGEATI